MKAVSIIYRTLTQTEFKAINDLIQSSGGGSQTYIDFPKGSVSDVNWAEFLGFEGESVTNGYKWIFKVHSLSLDNLEQEIEISSRRDTTNSLREQNKNRIAIWSSDNSCFPSASDVYDEDNNPICVYLLRDENGAIWAGWHFVNTCNASWYMNIELAAMFFNRKKGACGYIKLSSPVPFDTNIYTWPFISKEPISPKIKNMNNKPLQQIYYGAPGTGKSHATNEVTSKYPDTVRTTFHPDSDYSTFVGAYKPTMTKERKAVVIGQDEKEVNPLKDNSEWVEKISYRFVKQAFLKAYVKAWKKFKDTYVDGGELAPQFLVIEEINRGNCAQIFGDLFQLLDRKANFSEYPIEADSDICKALLEEDTDENPSFGADGLPLSIEQKSYINSIFDKEGEVSQQVAEKICKGEVLVLPPNLYIWATMNTSDQSLFPIDSAFKRRWAWKYVRINEGKTKDKQPLNFRIKFDVTDTEVVDESWWEFIKAINTKIEEATKSEDKKLGYFFCKPDKKAEGAGENDDNTIISAETFVGKVVFYLWQDVFKDYGFKSDIFKKDDGKRLAFHDFYPDNIDPDEEKNPEAIDLKLVKRFIEKVMNKKSAEPETPAPAEVATE